MSAEPQLFRINPGNKESERIEEVDFARLGFQERRDIQEWVAANPAILGDDLLIIGKEFSGFDRTNERLDLLAVDASGKLVIIELKRDDSGANVHWQAIKYASYLNRASADDIVRMLTTYEKITETEAQEKLLEHLDSGGLEALNNDQRIILTSHRFAPEVTSAALWLNEKALGEDLITCVQLTPHRDSETKSLYIQANTIIPVPGIEDYIIGIADASGVKTPVIQRTRGTVVDSLRKEDHSFFRKIRSLASDDLEDDLKPTYNASRSMGNHAYRYLTFWYDRRPWKARGLRYVLRLYRGTGSDPESAPDRVYVAFEFIKKHHSKDFIAKLKAMIEGLQTIRPNQAVDITPEYGQVFVSCDGIAHDDDFAKTVGATFARVIKSVTPLVDKLN